MDVLVLIGRILFALLFLGAGMGHFSQREMMTGYAASKGVPAAGLLVPLSGAVSILGGLMVAVGVWPDLGALLLVAFLVPTAFLMHAFWRESDRRARPTSRASSSRTSPSPAPPWRCSPCSPSRATSSAWSCSTPCSRCDRIAGRPARAQRRQAAHHTDQPAHPARPAAR